MLVFNGLLSLLYFTNRLSSFLYSSKGYLIYFSSFVNYSPGITVNVWCEKDYEKSYLLHDGTSKEINLLVSNTKYDIPNHNMKLCVLLRVPTGKRHVMITNSQPSFLIK